MVVALLKGDVQAERLLATNPVQARSVIEAELAALGGKKAKDNALSRAVARIEYTNDPLESSVLAQASRAQAAHLIKRSTPMASLAHRH